MHDNVKFRASYTDRQRVVAAIEEQGYEVPA